MADRLDKSARAAFVAKLKALRKATLPLYPNGEWWEADSIEEAIHTSADRLKRLFDRFELTDARQEVARVLKRAKGDLLWKVQEPPWHEGKIGVVLILQQFVDDLIFTYSDEDWPASRPSLEFQELLQLLKGIERSLGISRRYPGNEEEFQRLADSVLICRFPQLRRKPALSTPIKNFIPDSAIPEARTLIEYKYISTPSQVPAKVDEVFADLAGYRDKDWEHLVYVIYETERFVPEQKWAAQLKGLKGTQALVVRRIPAGKGAYQGAAAAAARSRRR